MNEVSCRALGVPLDALTERGIPHASLVEGLPVSLVEIEALDGRISWDVFTHILDRLESLLGGPEALEAAGHDHNRTASYAFVRRAASLFVRPRDIYWLGTVWFGRSLFGILEDDFEELFDGRIRETLRIPAGYRASKPFFHIICGALRAAPHLVGLPSARVEAEIRSRDAVFLITAPRARRSARSLLRSLQAPLRARGLIEELSAQQRELRARNNQLTATLDALRESEEKHRVAAALASDFCLAARMSPDGSGRISWVSDSMSRILGYSTESFDVTRWRDYVHPEDVQTVIRHVATALRDGFDRAEFRVLSPSGAEIWLLQSTRAVRDKQTGSIDIQAAGSDITERKRAEAARALLATAFEQSGEGVAILDAGGHIRYANAAFSAMMRSETDALEGAHIDSLAFGGGDGPLLVEMARELVRGKVWRGRYATNWGDGSRYVRDAVVTPVRDGNGRLDSYVGVIRDVTNEVRLEAELVQAQRMEALGRLTGGMAHDFNNLLTVISGSSEILLARDLDETSRETTVQIREAADRGSDLVRRLLAFSREQDLHPCEMDLNCTIGSLVKVLGQSLGEDIRIETRLSPDLGSSYADPAQIEQLLLNLALNARDAMPDGGRLRFETRDVVLSADEAAAHGLDPGPHVVVEVSDTGFGMDEATRARAFEPFFTTKEVGKGSGLGLSTVSGVAQQSGGSINVSSARGKGAVFTLLLPRVGDPVEATDEERGVPLLSPDAASVLLVETDDRVRRLARSALGGHGLSVVEARCPTEALDWVERQDFRLDLLLTDIEMPDMNGPDLCERVRGRHACVRVLYLSTGADLVRTGWRPPGGTQILFKPFTPSELLGEVRNLLGAARPGEIPAGTASAG